MVVLHRVVTVPKIFFGEKIFAQIEVEGWWRSLGLTGYPQLDVLDL